MKVRIVQVPVRQLDVSAYEDRYPRMMIGGWDVEFVVVDAGDMTLEDAQKHLRDGTIFELVEVSR